MTPTTELHIRHVEIRDAPALREIHARPEVIMGTMQLPFPQENHWAARIEALPPGSLSLVAEAAGALVGHASLLPCQPLRRKHAAGLGMAVHADWQRRGVASALMQALLDAADNWLDFRRVELDVFADNQAAIRLYEKFGFEREGHHRAHSFRNGEYVDVLTMARLAPALNRGGLR